MPNFLCHTKRVFTLQGVIIQTSISLYTNLVGGRGNRSEIRRAFYLSAEFRYLEGVMSTTESLDRFRFCPLLVIVEYGVFDNVEIILWEVVSVSEMKVLVKDLCPRCTPMSRIWASHGHICVYPTTTYILTQYVMHKSRSWTYKKNTKPCPPGMTRWKPLHRRKSQLTETGHPRAEVDQVRAETARYVQPKKH